MYGVDPSAWHLRTMRLLLLETGKWAIITQHPLFHLSAGDGSAWLGCEPAFLSRSQVMRYCHCEQVHHEEGGTVMQGGQGTAAICCKHTPISQRQESRLRDSRQLSQDCSPQCGFQSLHLYRCLLGERLLYLGEGQNSPSVARQRG